MPSSELYLAQHGRALSKQEDAERPLRAEGREEVHRVALVAAGCDVRVASVLHSGKRRAEETAALLAAHLQHPPGGLGEAPLAPNDDPAEARKLVEEASESLLLVGHLPHLGRLLSLLVAGEAERELVAFRNGDLVRLERDEEGAWRIGWILAPEIARP